MQRVDNVNGYLLVTKSQDDGSRSYELHDHDQGAIFISSSMEDCVTVSGAINCVVDAVETAKEPNSVATAIYKALKETASSRTHPQAATAPATPAAEPVAVAP